MTVLCVVQARTGSTRLPGKVLAELGGRPMLEYMLDRLSRLAVDELVVATTGLERDTPVADLAAAADRAVVRGPEEDVLSRFLLALDAHPAETVVRLTADCPLADPEIIQDVIELHDRRGAEYTCNVLPRTFPKGLDVEVMSADALRKAAAEAATQVEREHVTPFLYRRPQQFRLANLRSGDDLGDERWTVDTADDLAFVRKVVDAFGGRTDFGWRDVLAVAPPSAPSEALELGAVHLRTAQAADGERLLAWRNDAESVRQSISRRPVEPDEHRRWFAERLEDPGTRLWIAEVDAEPVGSVRIDVADAVGTVSIAIAPEARGRGLGSAVLRTLLQRLEGDLQVDSLEAHVRADNRASQRAFEKAGFRPAGGTDSLMLLRWVKMGSRERESAS